MHGLMEKSIPMIILLSMFHIISLVHIIRN